MQDDKFWVRYDAAARTLRWRMRGFWTVAEVAGLGAAMKKAVAPLGPPPLRMRSLCDSRDFPVQSPVIADALGALNDYGRQLRRGPVAATVRSMLNKLQAERTLATADVKVFLSLDEAEAWLAAQPLG